MHIPIPYNADFILALYCVRIEDFIRRANNDNEPDYIFIRNFKQYGKLGVSDTMMKVLEIFKIELHK